MNADHRPVAVLRRVSPREGGVSEKMDMAHRPFGRAIHGEGPVLVQPLVSRRHLKISDHAVAAI